MRIPEQVKDALINELVNTGWHKYIKEIKNEVLSEVEREVKSRDFINFVIKKVLEDLKNHISENGMESFSGNFSRSILDVVEKQIKEIFKLKK